jgi:hypothetical protein
VPLDTSRIRLVIFDWAGTTIDPGSRAPLVNSPKNDDARCLEPAA